MSRHFYFVPVGSSCLAYMHRVELSRHLLPWNIFWTNSFICFIVHYIFFLLEKKMTITASDCCWSFCCCCCSCPFWSWERRILGQWKKTRSSFVFIQIKFGVIISLCMLVCVLIGVNARANILWMNSQHFVYIDQKKKRQNILAFTYIQCWLWIRYSIHFSNYLLLSSKWTTVSNETMIDLSAER